jgi:TetR/AcrR family transcriptional regulator
MKRLKTRSRTRATKRPTSRRPRPRTRARPPQPPKDVGTERRILDAAHAVFIRRGTSGARMQEIARAAGVNQALLHYYFRSKELLARAAFGRAATELMPAVIQVMASADPLEAKVERVVEIELRILGRAPYLPGYIISEVTHHPERTRQLIEGMTGLAAADLRPRVFGTLRTQIDRRVAEGAMRPIAAETFLVNLLALCIFPFAVRPLLMALVGLDERGFEQFIDRRRTELAAFFLGALRP